jgi:hypothetical protein
VGRLLRGTWNKGPSSSSLRLEDVIMEHLYIPAYKLTSIDQDELFYLRNMQEGITELRSLARRRRFATTTA